MSIDGALISRGVLIDSSAYYALGDPKDQSHADAEGIVGRILVENRQILTTNFIVAETHALILNRRNRDLAAAFLHTVDNGLQVVIRVSEADEFRAREIIARYDDKAFTPTDATSFAVMERLGLRSAFSRLIGISPSSGLIC